MTDKDKIEKSEILRKAGSLSVSLALMLIAFLFIPQKINPETAQQAQKQEALIKDESLKNAISQKLDLEAKAFLAYDIENNKILFSKNEKMILPLASLTKIMTVLTASGLASDETTINIGDADGRSTGVLSPKEKWSLKNLADLTLVSSSNFGAQSIASAITAITGTNFVTQMNQNAQAIGLNNMSFTNETGLDINNTISANNGSAQDVANLFTYVLKNKPEIFDATTKKTIAETSLDNRNHIAVNTNEIVDKIPGLIASKTGLTDTAGGNLAIIANLGLRRPIAFVVMGSSEKGRFTDTQKLVEAVQDYLNYN